LDYRVEVLNTRAWLPDIPIAHVRLGYMRVDCVRAAQEVT
jgi:hypothetical protein